MQTTSKKASLLILGITAFVLSGLTLHLFNDPEGPNLLVVLGAAVVLYIVSLGAYSLSRSVVGGKKLVLSIVVQVVVAVIFYLLLK